MIKRLDKKKNSKQGAILVIVVLILALAMIFITAAMMLTQATRGRLYDNTMQSQARLTVTAASEVFLEALITQEITDDQIDKMLSENPSRHDDDADKIKMIVDGVPGMSSSDDNCTLLDIYYPDTSNLDIVNADFSTIIGDQRENVRIVLSVKHEDPHYGGRFKNQIDIASSVTTSQVRFNQGVGMVNPALGVVDDNTILFRGNAYEQTSDAVFFSDIIFAEGATGRFGGGNLYKGNMVFLDKAYMSGTSTVKGIQGDMYFIGNSTHDAGFKWENDNIWSSVNSKNFIFAGRSIQDDPSKDQNQKIKELLNKSGNKCYFIGSSSATASGTNSKGTYTVTNAGGTLTDSTMKSKLSLYQSYDYKKSTDPYPTNVVTQVFADLNADGKTHKIAANTKLTRTEYTTDGKVLAKDYTTTEEIEVISNPITDSYPDWKKVDNGSGGLKVKDDLVLDMSKLSTYATNGVISLKAGYYQVKPGKTTDDNGIKPYIIAIDGSKADQYRFFFAAGQYNINNCVFAVYNVQTDAAPVLFILEDGAKLEFSGANFRTNNCLCTAGFICINRGCSSPTAIANYIRNTPRADTEHNGEEKVWSTTHTDKDGHQIKYSKYYDGIVKPSIYIFGTGNNEFKVGDSCTFEAYIGLYEHSYFMQRNDIASKVIIYGRIETDSFKNGDNPTGDFQMPYCPAPGESSSEPDERAAKTKFEIAQIIYYY